MVDLPASHLGFRSDKRIHMFLYFDLHKMLGKKRKKKNNDGSMAILPMVESNFLKTKCMSHPIPVPTSGHGSTVGMFSKLPSNAG